MIAQIKAIEYVKVVSTYHADIDTKKRLSEQIELALAEIKAGRAVKSRRVDFDQAQKFEDMRIEISSITPVELREIRENYKDSRDAVLVLKARAKDEDTQAETESESDDKNRRAVKRSKRNKK